MGLNNLVATNPQQPASAAYPQQPGSGTYPQQSGSGAYPQQSGAAMPQQPGAGMPQPSAGYQPNMQPNGSYAQQPWSPSPYGDNGNPTWVQPVANGYPASTNQPYGSYQQPAVNRPYARLKVIEFYTDW
jgi:hypothetical protein